MNNKTRKYKMIQSKYKYYNETKKTITVSWIGANSQTSKDHYKKEKENINNSATIFNWDVTQRKNVKAKKGDLFVFVDNTQNNKALAKVEVYIIKDVLGSERRKDYWAKDGYNTYTNPTDKKETLEIDSKCVLKDINWSQFYRICFKSISPARSCSPVRLLMSLDDLRVEILHEFLSGSHKYCEEADTNHAMGPQIKR